MQFNVVLARPVEKGVALVRRALERFVIQLFDPLKALLSRGRLRTSASFFAGYLIFGCVGVMQAGKAEAASASLRRCPRDYTPLTVLFFGDDMNPAVLLPAGFGVLRAHRILLAIAHGVELAAGDAGIHEIILRRFGAGIAQSDVVFGGATLVAIALDLQLVTRILTQDLRQLL